jgi:hypothetical protein
MHSPRSDQWTVKMGITTKDKGQRKQPEVESTVV